MSKTWEELSRIALLGTERAAPDEALMQYLQSLGVDLDQGLSKILLEGSAYIHQMNKAGFPLMDFDGEIEPVVDEGSTICNARSAQHLQAILRKDYEDVLEEFIIHLKAAKKEIPPESLPDLLDKAKNNRTFWHKIEPIIGKRGHWLIGLNRSWKNLGQATKITESTTQPPKSNKDWQLLIESEWQASDAKALEQLIPLLPSAPLNVMLHSGNIDLATANSLVGRLLLYSKANWEDAISVQFINKLKTVIVSQNSFAQGTAFYKKVLKNAGLRVAPHLVDELKKGWEVHNDQWQFWEKDIERFFKTLLFRQKMIQALHAD